MLTICTRSSRGSPFSSSSIARSIKNSCCFFRPPVANRNSSECCRSASSFRSFGSLLQRSVSLVLSKHSDVTAMQEYEYRRTANQWRTGFKTCLCTLAKRLGGGHVLQWALLAVGALGGKQLRGLLVVGTLVVATLVARGGVRLTQRGWWVVCGGWWWWLQRKRTRSRETNKKRQNM